MIIRITDGSTTQTLAAGSARALGSPIGPSGLRISGPVAVQQQAFLRGAASKAVNKGNMQSVIAFSVAYEFATVTEAEVFTLTHRSSVLRAGSLVMQLNGGATSTVSDCVVTDPVCTMNGCSVRVDYSIVGGAQTYELPEGVDAGGDAMIDADGNTMIFQTA